MSEQTPHSLINWTFLIILAIIWGGSFMGAKLALDGFGPMTIAALRLLIASTILVGYACLFRNGLPKWETPTDKRIWLHILGMGLFTNAIPFTLLNWGQLRVQSGFAGISMAVVPLLVLPLAHFLVKGDQMTRKKVIGFIIGFIGVIILIGPEKFIDRSGDPLEPIARLACIVAACCYAIGSIITRLCPPVGLISYSAAGLLIGTIGMVPVALYFEGIPEMASTTAIAGVIYLGVFPTALATLMLVYVINNAGPSFMSQVNYQVPIWAIIFGVVFLNETLPASFIWALGLILMGLLVSQWKHRA
ncbi:DMT family transporter [Amylibacter sp. SFDW26]|uniref:DMT family transporter n=1 Tax=Amylibacter sp. SFDW26 TaxID=2652722 RepID=UPI00126261D2|nr:DMT family transporter [Amylibacter sp. SFDW26]KAB7615528.1 DMT family transporter [Amylibacter sp. SFDW26]